MSLTLLFFRGGGLGAVYIDAPAERYVWAPPTPNEFVAFAPLVLVATPPTPIPLVADTHDAEFVAPEFHGFVTTPPGGSFTA